MNWVWDHSQSRHGSRLVLLALADCGGVAWPSIAELMRKTGLTERAVQTAIADLINLGELAVDRNGGPKGCNRYRVIMPKGGAESAPPQNLHPAEDAAPQNQQDAASSQANGQNPAESAPPADSAPPQNSTPDPAESAPGTRREPEENSPTESSSGGPGEAADSALFDAGSGKTTQRRARKPRSTTHPRFPEWYAAYPLHKAPGDAEKAYLESVAKGADPDDLLAGAIRYSVDPQVKRGYIKYPAGWLRSKCWLDEPTPAANGSGARPRGHQPYTNPADQSAYDERY